MAITKAFAVSAHNSASAGALTTGTFDSTGYTHLVVFFKHEGAAATLTPSDNKSSSSWNSLTQENHTNGDENGQMFWVKIGSPGSGHTVTVTPSANRAWRGLIVWRVNVDSGTAELDAQTNAEGDSAAPDGGSLATTGASVVSFMGCGLYDSAATAPGSGWTEDVDGAGVTHAGFSRASETTSPIDPACTWSANNAWVVCAASLREGAGGGGGASGRDLMQLGVGT